MGSFLDKPKTEKATSRAEGNGLRIGMSDMQGWRVDMEDAHTILPEVDGWKGHSFFGVYDGHGGSMVSNYAAEHLLPTIRKKGGIDAEDMATLKKSVKSGFLALDSEMRELPAVKSGEDHSGSTCIVGIVSKEYVLIANCGDSRAVLSRVGSSVHWGSEDHKPSNEPEQKRIESAGGSVVNRRVNGDLAVSRAFGDFLYKHRMDLPDERQQVSAEPELTDFDIRGDEEYLILCCDGIWDVMSNEECVDFVRTTVAKGEVDLGCVAEMLLDTCLARGSRDNMSALIVAFPSAKQPPPSVVEEYKKKKEEARIREEAEKAEKTAGS